MNLYSFLTLLLVVGATCEIDSCVVQDATKTLSQPWTGKCRPKQDCLKSGLAAVAKNSDGDNLCGDDESVQCCVEIKCGDNRCQNNEKGNPCASGTYLKNFRDRNLCPYTSSEDNLQCCVMHTDPNVRPELKSRDFEVDDFFDGIDGHGDFDYFSPGITGTAGDAGAGAGTPVSLTGGGTVPDAGAPVTPNSIGSATLPNLGTTPATDSTNLVTPLTPNSFGSATLPNLGTTPATDSTNLGSLPANSAPGAEGPISQSAETLQGTQPASMDTNIRGGTGVNLNAFNSPTLSQPGGPSDGLAVSWDGGPGFMRKMTGSGEGTPGVRYVNNAVSGGVNLDGLNAGNPDSFTSGRGFKSVSGYVSVNTDKLKRFIAKLRR